jgi:hypothetical protein
MNNNNGLDTFFLMNNNNGLDFFFLMNNNNGLDSEEGEQNSVRYVHKCGHVCMYTQSYNHLTAVNPIQLLKLK